MKPCPCGSPLSYDECCRPLISGTRAAATAEELMRSRYSAYVEREIPYLRTSLSPDQRKDYDETSSREWAESAEWHSLQILNTSGGGPADRDGTVEFVATFTRQGVRQEHREVSTFVREGGTWYFAGGKVIGPKPVVREAAKVGRNDPCSCGSGKKYKKCCGT
ncbi:MAG: YchJ family protein [Planctomycetes bacterium]|nr:YchJ family protein [Planctomycetota bacterium]